MKKILYLLFFMPILILAQTQSENYIKNISYKVKTINGTTNADNGTTLSNDNKSEKITYLDGLGRIKQRITKQAGGGKEDVITYISYDELGRKVKDYLPFANGSNNEDIRTGNIELLVNQFYKNKYPDDFTGVDLPNINAYSEKVLDNSPLSKVLKIAAPGKNWRKESGHAIKFDHQSNINNEVLKFGVSFSIENVDSPGIPEDRYYYPQLVIADRYYNANQLYKTITKNENWKTYDGKDKTTEEFKDKQGKIVLRRTYNNQQPHDTYYVYDDFDNLIYVLPPLASEKANVYETGMVNYPVGNFVTGGNATGTARFGVQQTAPGTYKYTADFDFQNLGSSTFKTGYIMDLPYTHPSMGSYSHLGSVSVSENSNGVYAYRYVYFYAKEGKLYSYNGGYSSNGVPLTISTFDKITEVNLPQNLAGFSEIETQEQVKELLDKLCYQYKYDRKNRLIEKKIPGKGWEYTVYDNLGRPVLTQDANQKEKSPDEWLFIKYDALGRIVYTGIYKSIANCSRSYLQATFNRKRASENYEAKVILGTGFSETYYTNTNFPSSDIEILTVNYYDDYIFDRAGAGTTVTTYEDSTERLKGLSTGGRVRVLGTDDWITTISYYNEKSRQIYVYTKNDYLQTSDILESKLDFTGKVLETKTTHKKNGNTDIVIIDKFDYDHAERLLSQKQQINDQTEELIAKNHYDELGQLIKKDVGNSEVSPLQEVDYTYNVRGWLKKINDPNIGLGSDLFSFELMYHESGSLYNGNISRVNWKTASDNSFRYYNYYYDDLNRITRAYYSSWNQYSRFNIGSIAYDKNGNIERLYRRGAIVDQPDAMNASHYGTMDYLSYSYDGNQLTKVSDTGNDNFGFKDGVNLDTEYIYDSNGNMTKDLNKGINNITYNHLNLPTQVYFNSNKFIDYIYDATGIKQGKKVTNSSNITATFFAGNYVYENDNLEFFNTSEGYATPNNSGKFDYIYQYKDHLGNVRLSYTENPDIDTPETVFMDNATITQGWDSNGPSSGGSAVVATDKSYSGEKSFKIHRTTGTSHYAHSNERVAIDNDEETAYTFSGRVFVESAGYAWGRIILFMDDETGTGISTEIAHGDKIKIKGEWVYYEKTVMVPANIDKINLRIGLYHQTNNATAWFDDLKIVKGNLSRTTLVEESNYYPFGLKHKGYNNVVNSFGNSKAQKKGFQDQVLDDDLGLNWNTFKFRNYDASLARFHNIDPLTEDYVQWTPYAFSGNRVIDAFELEGLEPVDAKKGAKHLVVVVQGYGGEPGKGNTLISRDYTGLGAVEKGFGNKGNIQVTTYASSRNSGTVGDASKTINNFMSANPNGSVILVGHSLGGDNVMNIAGEVNHEIELMVTLDIADYWDSDNAPSNVKNVVNISQNNDFPSNEDVEVNNNKKTKVQNFRAKKSTHRSIDQDFIGTILQMIQNMTQTKPNKTNTKKPASHVDVEKQD